MKELLKSIPASRMSYDPNTHEFSVGNTSVPLMGSAQETFLAILGAIKPEDTMETVPLVGITDIARPLVTPAFTTWIKTQAILSSDTALLQVPTVMKDSYALLSPASDVHKVQINDRLWGFGVEITRPGHVSMNVLGNCACMYVEPDGYAVGYRDWGSGYAEYNFHNTDTPEQTVSLLAGLGFLALEAERSGA